MQLDYTIWGDSNTTGMGIHCSNLLKALIKAGKKVAFVNMQPLNYQIMNEYIKEGLNNRELITGREPAIMVKYAESSIRFIGNPRMAFSIFESDLIPELEKVYYNTLDTILVPSEWGKDILTRNGIDGAKIKIVHEGVDPEIFHVKHNYEYNIERARRRGYWTFLHVGKWERRKNTRMIVECFYEACEELKIHANLRLKCNNPFDNTWHSQLVEIRNKYTDKYATVGAWRDDLSDMADLYNDADFGLYASSGEAWNLPLLESMACGLPSICTNTGGQSEYIKNLPIPAIEENDCYVVRDLIIRKTKKEIADDGMFYKGDRGSWLVPDRMELKEKIKYILQNAEAVIRLKQAYADSVKQYTWDNAIEGLL